jgi:hypothetical protein
MRLDEEDYFELYDLAVAEGAAVLLPAPLRELPLGAPPAWAEILTATDCRAAAARLWSPVAARLPHVHRALRERLWGVAYLSTETLAASLLYLFRDGDELFEYRGRAPLPERTLKGFSLPPEITDLYRIHDGWTLYATGDLGPSAAGDWASLSELDLEIDWRPPPGEFSMGELRVFYREEADLLLAFDCSQTPARPMRCGGDGRIEVLLDPWQALDREIAVFLEELDPVPGEQTGATPLGAFLPRLPELGRRYRDEHALAIQLGGGSINLQSADLLMRRAELADREGKSRERIEGDRRKALEQWCEGVELGCEVSPRELISVLGLAEALGDTAAADFVITLPPALWDDDSLGALQVHVLVALRLGDREQAELMLDELLGQSFDGEGPPDWEDEVTARLLEALVQGEEAGYMSWRRTALAELAAPAPAPAADGVSVPWSIRIHAFEGSRTRPRDDRRSQP